MTEKDELYLVSGLCSRTRGGTLEWRYDTDATTATIAISTSVSYQSTTIHISHLPLFHDHLIFSRTSSVPFIYPPTPSKILGNNARD